MYHLVIEIVLQQTQALRANFSHAYYIIYEVQIDERALSKKKRMQV